MFSPAEKVEYKANRFFNPCNMNISIICPAFSVDTTNSDKIIPGDEAIISQRNIRESIHYNREMSRMPVDLKNNNNFLFNLKKKSSPTNQKNSKLQSSAHILRKRRKDSKRWEERSRGIVGGKGQGSNVHIKDQAETNSSICIHRDKIENHTIASNEMKSKSHLIVQTSPENTHSKTEISVSALRKLCSHTLGIAVDDLELYCLQKIPSSSETTSIQQECSKHQKIHIAISIKESCMLSRTLGT